MNCHIQSAMSVEVEEAAEEVAVEAWWQFQQHHASSHVKAPKMIPTGMTQVLHALPAVKQS